MALERPEFDGINTFADLQAVAMKPGGSREGCIVSANENLYMVKIEDMGYATEFSGGAEYPARESFTA